MKRYKDDRISPNSRVYREEDRVVLTHRFLTPFRLTMVYILLWHPLAAAWKLTMCFLAVDAFVYLGGEGDMFALHPFERKFVYGGALLAFGLWHYELISGYKINRFLFSKKLRISISETNISIGWGIMKRSFERTQHLMFGIKPFEMSTDPTYRNAKGLYMIVADARRVMLTEIFGLHTADEVVGSANIAIGLSSEPRNLA